ncbi:MAG: class B sortase [Acetatifactor sp.]|nr:class B sortase [Acetatifactor sp.]
MAQKVYIVEGRRFRTREDYARAMHDKKIIDEIRSSVNLKNRAALEKLEEQLKGGKYRFYTLLGEDFRDEIRELLGKGAQGRTTPVRGKAASQGKTFSARGKTEAPPEKASSVKTKNSFSKAEMDSYVLAELKRQEKRRKLIIAACSIVAAGCLGYFGVYAWHSYRTDNTYQALSALKEKPVVQQYPSASQSGPQFTLDEAREPREVLEEYKNLLNKNKKLIGWVKIDDTNIDYPVMQTVDNEYYLNHNLNQEYDKNGSIFMDKDCDVLKPSTNFIIYGHHMKNGQMFGGLDRYASKEYYEKHPYIQFDTIYDKGTWEVMYVFRSRVYSEEEIVFKYYQFIDANSEQEFDSNMREMAAMSLYDTGVTASYGDQLLTLSTCDYQEKNGRFVVVAKKIAKE